MHTFEINRETFRCQLSGVLADAVGLGKTAVTIGLILSDRIRSSCSSEPISLPRFNQRAVDHYGRSVRMYSALPGESSAHFCETRTTLVVCPSHLCKQWADELKKFAGTALKCLVLPDSENNAYDWEEVCRSDVCITSLEFLLSSNYASSRAAFEASSSAFAKKSGIQEFSVPSPILHLHHIRYRRVVFDGENFSFCVSKLSAF